MCIVFYGGMIQCVYMPRFNVYIRKQDLFAWEKIHNKSQWIHQRLLDGHRAAPKTITMADLSSVCPKGHFYTGTKCMQKGCNVI